MSEEQPSSGRAEAARSGAGRRRPAHATAQQFDAFTGRDVRGRARQLELFEESPESEPAPPH